MLKNILMRFLSITIVCLPGDNILSALLLYLTDKINSGYFQDS